MYQRRPARGRRRDQRRSAPPDAVFPEDFGYVHTVRELPGGDVLVADPLGKGTAGRGGSRRGSGEYQQPDASALPGDSTLMVGRPGVPERRRTGDRRTADPPATGNVSLGPPDAVFPEDFGYVHTVRELPGGDVLVADPLGKALYRVDMDAGVRAVVGKLGEGPGEYQQPDAVWPLPGDSTLMVDLGKGQLVRVGPELEFGTAHPIAMFQEDGGVVMAIPAGIDLGGNVYAAAMGGFPPDPDGRGAILRIGLAEGSVDTAGSFKRRASTSWSKRSRTG